MTRTGARDGSLRAALVLAFGLTLLHMPSGLPAPLYPLYENTMGITSATVSMLFATYVVGVLAGLVLVPLTIRQRYVLVSACGLSILADLLFLAATGPAALFGGHLLQGVVLGLFTGVVPVLLAELDMSGVNKTVGRLTTSANAVGLAAGPLWSGVLLQYAPWRGELVWVIQIAATLAIMPFMRIPAGLGQDTGERVPLRRVLGALTGGWSGPAALLAGFCAFSSGGLLASLGSVVLDSVIGVGNGAVEGVLVSVCFVLSAVAGAMRLRRSDIAAIRLGLVWTAVGSLALIAAVELSSLAVMAAAAVICGVGQGFGLQGAIQLIAVQSDAASRGKAVSFFFIWCYLGTTIASFGVGAVITVAGLGASFNGYSGLVAVLCAAGLVCCSGAARRERQDSYLEEAV
ncbi:MFS transporter [Kitasatospora sp. HPMI-4]|uniref:MFS transporter n=1 Tax=Kitasatospora sp. HPMI-4 TaxID=3448443 RepID=UPI003F19FC58